MSGCDLAGKRAIVAGGGGRLSSAMCRGLYEAGAELAVIRRGENVATLATRLSAASTVGRTVHALRGDLTDRGALDDAFGTAFGRLGGVDILVADQGIARPRPVLDHDDAWAETLGKELAPVGVTVKSIAPGYIKTNASIHLWRDDPDRIAEILAPPAGVVLPVDGGWLSR